MSDGVDLLSSCESNFNNHSPQEMNYAFYVNRFFLHFLSLSLCSLLNPLRLLPFIFASFGDMYIFVYSTAKNLNWGVTVGLFEHRTHTICMTWGHFRQHLRTFHTNKLSSFHIHNHPKSYRLLFFWQCFQFFEQSFFFHFEILMFQK